MAFQGQNAFGVREHQVRTLQAAFGERGDHGRPVDLNVIGVVERRSDRVKPIFGMIRNPGDTPFSFSIEDSSDAEQDPSDSESPYANAYGNLEITAADDGDTVEVGDGTNTVTFEFDDDGSVAGGNVSVPVTTSALGALRNLVLAIHEEWKAGRLGVSAEDITERSAGTATTTPTARLTHNLTGAANQITVTLTGTTGTFTGGANGGDPLDFRHYPEDGAAATVNTVTVPPRALVQFTLEGATQRYLRFKVLPPDYGLTNPRGSSRPQAYLEVAHYHGVLEPYSRSNASHLSALPN